VVLPAVGNAAAERARQPLQPGELLPVLLEHVGVVQLAGVEFLATVVARLLKSRVIIMYDIRRKLLLTILT
jgi:hypothetical protein